jgi:hypothetical protein
LLGVIMLCCGLGRLFSNPAVARLRTIALGAFLSGVLTLALGIGWGRAALGHDAGFADRYILLTTPLLLVWYFQGVLEGDSIRGRRIQAALFVLMCLLLPVNLRKGYRSAADFHSRFVALEQDIRMGLSSAGLACRHAFIYPNEPVLATRLEALRRTHFRAFAEADASGPLHAVQVSPLKSLPQWNTAAGNIRLKAGESLSREFPVASGCELKRIDVQASLWRRGRMPATLHWRLRAEEQGQGLVLREGEIELSQLQHQRFLTLPCGLHVENATNLELCLEAPVELRSGQYAEFPTFRSPQDASEELNIFLFIQPASPLASSAVSRR